MIALEIKNEYSILHFDEYPILFMGFNHKCEIVIGSFLFENDDDNTLSYIYSIVPSYVVASFVSKSISYLELLKKVNNIFIVTKDYNENILDVKETSFKEIDPDILPLPSSYCPDIDESVIEKFGIYSMWTWKPHRKRITSERSIHYLRLLEEDFKFSHRKSPKSDSYQDINEYGFDQLYIASLDLNPKVKQKRTLDYA